MKSWIYLSIFVLIVAVICAGVLYNAKKIKDFDIDGEEVVIKKKKQDDTSDDE